MRERLVEALQRVRAAVTSSRAMAYYTVLMGLIAVSGTLYLSVRFNGVIDTVVYALIFLFCATLFPVGIGLLGSGFPANTSLGRGHIVLGAFAFGHHYLVQLEDRWEWCPGEEGRVYIDGEWHEIVSGEENKSVLGWRPFGILRYKDDETLAHARVDTKAETVRDAASTDGGGVTRGGWAEAPEPTVSGIDGNWLVDLKRVFSSGIRTIGDIDLIETAEEVIERGQVSDGRMSSLGPMVTFVVSLVLGIGLGYLVLYTG